MRSLCNRMADVWSLDKLFTAVSKTIAFIGLPLNKAERSKWDVCLALVAFAPVLLFVAFQVASALQNTADLTFVGTCLLILTSNINAIPKFITFVAKVHELRTLRSIVLQNTTVSANKAEQRLLRRYTRIAILTTGVIASSFMLAYLLVIVGTYAYSLLVAGMWLNPLMVKIPAVSEISHPGYDLHMLLTHYVIGYLILIRASTDLFFFYCTLYAAYRFEVCKLLVAQVGDVMESAADTRRHVQRVIDVHTHVFRFCRLCSRTFEWIIFFEVASITSTLVVALTMRDTSPMLFTFSIQLTTGQFFTFCLFAELVNSKVSPVQTLCNRAEFFKPVFFTLVFKGLISETSDAIYLSHWYNILDIGTRKQFLFLLQCSQYELSFKSFGLIKLSLETFVNVLKAAFSYYTFMQSVL